MHRMVDGQRVELTAEEEAEIKAEWAKNEAEAKAREWLDNRLAAYPPIKDQLDMMFHDMDGWKAMISKIKADNPKPS